MFCWSGTPNAFLSLKLVFTIAIRQPAPGLPIQIAFYNALRLLYNGKSNVAFGKFAVTIVLFLRFFVGPLLTHVRSTFIALAYEVRGYINKIIAGARNLQYLFT